MEFYLFNMAIPQTGSALSGDPDAQAAVKAAIQARSQGTSVPQIAQTGQQPQGQVPQPIPGVPSPQGQSPTLGQGAQAPIKTEAELIGRGLMQRLSAISKIETASVETPDQPSARVAPTS